MELKRRRWRLKSYDQCFSGSDALQWLYSYLQNHPSFGTHVTREQAFMLLQKFLESNVFLGVVEKNSKKFQDTNHLYRFVDDRPEKSENEKNGEETKEDKENFTSRSSLTNLIRTISKRNSKYFGENNPEENTGEGKENDELSNESKKNDYDKNVPPLGSVSITPLTKDFNHVSLQSASKDNPSFDYSNVSTLLFPTEDEDDGDEVFETSIRNHFFTRSNSVQMRNRYSRPPSIRRPLGTLWINEFDKTETQFPTETIDKKSDKKRTILRNFGKTSIIKKTTILGKRKSGDTLAQSADLPKLKKLSEKDHCTETNTKFTSIARKNKKGSQDSLSSGPDALPRKALALLGEDAGHIQEVESYAAYYPVKYERRRRNSSSKSSLAGSRENVGNLSNDSKLNKLGSVSKSTRTSLNRLHSISNPININSKKEISHSNRDVSRSHPTINELGTGRISTRSFLKKARSFSCNIPPPDKMSASPKLQRRPAQRHAMVRRNTVKWRRLQPASASTGIEEGYPFTETDLTFDANRLYKVPSTWSIDTIGLLREAEEKNNDNSPEITAEDVEETWKSVVVLRYS